MCPTLGAIMPLFSTMVMLGLPMTRQFRMETCGEYRAETGATILCHFQANCCTVTALLKFWSWVLLSSTTVNYYTNILGTNPMGFLVKSVLMSCVLQSVWHGWRVLLLHIWHHLLLPSQRQVHSRPEGHLWSCPQVIPRCHGCAQTRLTSCFWETNTVNTLLLSILQK